MHLEKLEIQGFKSFASKNTLIFPNPKEGKKGITAIVGPNGSGKSNIADAVRWALGEQSLKTLRGKKAEDVIFSGSDKKGRLGMAEVSLFLNNEDRAAPVDYSEVALTRRLYRDGESEYLLNNRRVRLTDIQVMLARASFGQRTYSVIGQGMVESFLNTSLAERKEFFDEATGVKQYQIKRDDALNKLGASYERLTQARVLLNEIAPRLASLTRQVNRLRRRGEIEKELKEIQIRYYGSLWHEIDGIFSRVNSGLVAEEREKSAKEKKFEGLKRETEKLEQQVSSSLEVEKWQEALNVLQAKKDGVVRRMASVAARIEVKLELGGKTDIAWLAARKEEIGRELKKVIEEIAPLENKIKEAEKELEVCRKEKEGLEKKAAGLEEKISFASRKNPEAEWREAERMLKDILASAGSVDQEDDLAVLKKKLAEIRRDLEKVIKKIADKDGGEEFEAARKELLSLAAEKEKIIVRIGELGAAVSSKKERIGFFEEKKESLENELEKIGAKLKADKGGNGGGELEAEKKSLEKEEREIAEAMAEAKKRLDGFSREEGEKRRKFFNSQRQLQAAQDEINRIAARLNDFKVRSAREETRLEELENRIRQEGLGLKEIKEASATSENDREKHFEKISALKRQLELIGGIDPEAEKEYHETKERHDFLSDQIDDLSGAIKSLEKIIEELDRTIKEKFDREFREISKKFEEYFKILFNGGSAKIVKVMASEEEKVSDEEGGQPLKTSGGDDAKKIKFLRRHNATGLAGIEIQATPPGKKIQSISMLSGGERALTAIALICAIISANPSPFVFFDEVDAALDEANSERLAKILDDLSHKTQFVVITHNRASMRRAGILYGVTMQDDGVSKLLSVKLEGRT